MLPPILKVSSWKKRCTCSMTFWKPGQHIRLLGVGVSDLDENWQQMSLFEPQLEREIRLHQAVDEIREKFGKTLLQRGKIRK